MNNAFIWRYKNFYEFLPLILLGAYLEVELLDHMVISQEYEKINVFNFFEELILESKSGY